MENGGRAGLFDVAGAVPSVIVTVGSTSSAFFCMV